MTWPSSPEKLTLGGMLTQRLGQVILSGLKSLTLGERFNQSLSGVTLPLDSKFNWSLEQVTLPSSLKNLTFDGQFDQSLEGVILPCQISKA